MCEVFSSYIFDFEINPKERKNIIEKASICINGISLTISKKTKKGFQISKFFLYCLFFSYHIFSKKFVEKSKSNKYRGAFSAV